jgi:hypothetical protein
MALTSRKKRPLNREVEHLVCEVFVGSRNLAEYFPEY